MAAKRLAVILGVCLLGMSAMGGCGSHTAQESEEGIHMDSVKTEQNDESGQEAKTGEADAATAESADTDENKGSGYVFESGSVQIKVDMDMAPIAEQLGEPSGYYEEPSCAAQGIAKIYTYSGFEIETYPDGERDLIACVVLKDDSVATPEGVDLSMTKEQIISVYGSDCEETETSLVYEKDGTKLCFILDGEEISSIEYDSPVLN